MDKRLLATALTAALLLATLYLVGGRRAQHSPSVPGNASAAAPRNLEENKTGSAPGEDYGSAPSEGGRQSTVALPEGGEEKAAGSGATGLGSTQVNSSAPAPTPTKNGGSGGATTSGGNELTRNGTKSGEEGALLAHVRSWAYQLQNADPGQIAAAGFDLAVIDYSRDGSDEGAYTRGEILAAEERGVVMVAYLSIGEAEDYRFYWREDWSRSPPEWLGPENPEWRGDYAVRYWHREWREIIYKYLDRIIAQGFQGVYLDKVDEFEYWGEHGVDEAWAAREMIKLIVEIARYARSKAGPGFLVFVQNGERLLDYDNGSLLSAVSGWASEDVFYDGLEPSPWTGEKVPRLDRVVKAGKLVLVVDYVDDGSRSAADIRRIEAFRKMALDRGYIPYAALVDRELDELNVIPGLQP